MNKKIFIYELIVKVGFSKSKSESRKLIRGNGVKKNRILVKDEMTVVLEEEIIKNKELLISVGKKKHFRIILK